MKTWVISDTHCNEDQLTIPKDIELVIHAGDSTNSKDWLYNEKEFNKFIDWYANLDAPNKILIAGNHDAWATKKWCKDKVKDLGIYYLEHDYLELNGKLFFGSPYTPTFSDWHFMVSRSKIYRYWEVLEENIDVLITHGPPKTILDLSFNKDGILEFCGDMPLFNKVKKVQPKYHVFGHIHNVDFVINSGIRTLPDLDTTFINASCVTDRKMDVVSSHGFIINL